MSKTLVFFNASVIITGIISPKGGSAKVLSWAKREKIHGIISEVIFSEVLRHTNKIGKDEGSLTKEILKLNFRIVKAPSKLNSKFKTIVVDPGDVHVLTSALESKVKYLITLDAKHILSLSSKVKEFKIVTPGQLIEELE